ncbi:hypothetical protein CDAR_524311 [Caerostris darwini]|uniref:Uncharacterized protein n=1 Tax=Caerostris darwini TaxID=1538125 RepID=A0AAV4S8G4_9ARAC|nr:hypothetical protein CDAR_524311 [Caerostris darwini]
MGGRRIKSDWRHPGSTETRDDRWDVAKSGKRGECRSASTHHEVEGNTGTRWILLSAAKTREFHFDLHRGLQFLHSLPTQKISANTEM